MFSIQSGQPDQGGSLSRELKAKVGAGAIAGSALGVVSGILAGVTARNSGLKIGATVVGASAIVGAIAGALSVLGSKKRLSEAKDTDMNSLLDYLYNTDKVNTNAGFKDIKDINLERYIQEDQDPRNYMVTFGYDKGILVINLNKPTDRLIKSLNDSLESMIKFNRRADYSSEATKDGFMIYVIVPSMDAAVDLIYNVIAENKIKVNALTMKSLKKTKNFSESEPEQKEFNSKAQKARRAKWDKKVAEDIWGKQADEKTAKRVGRDSQKNNTVSLDKKSGKARVNYENSKIQDLKGRNSREILDAIEGEKKLNSGTFDKIVDRAKRLDSRIISNTVEKDLPVEEKLDKLTRAAKLQTKLIGRQHNLKDQVEKVIENKKAEEQLKQNLKKGGKIALAAGGTVAAGIGAKKLYDKKKKKDSKEKESKKD